jgi:RNA polymerase sigma-70 factor (ECF subfamily)
MAHVEHPNLKCNPEPPMDKRIIRAVERAKNGDHHAFTVVVDAYAKLVYAQVYVIVQSHQDAEDVAQDAFLRAYRHLGNLEKPETIRAWILAIARNLARDLVRRRHRLVFSPALLNEELPDPAGPPSDQLGAAERRARLATELAGLPAPHQRALAMRYLDGLDHRSIESAMGVSNGRLRGLLGRALTRLRNRMGGDNR